MHIARVTDIGDAPLIVDDITGWSDAASACSPGRDHLPNVEMLESFVANGDGHVVLAAVEDDVTVGLVVCRRADGRIIWALAHPDRYARIVVDVATVARDMIGMSVWGVVGNATLRDSLLAEDGVTRHSFYGYDSALILRTPTDGRAVSSVTVGAHV